MDVRKKLFETMNRVFGPVLASGPVNRLFGVRTCTLSFEGRRSGRPVTLPVWYKTTPDGIRVQVAAPGQKNWWRNFRSRPHAVTATIDGVSRAGTGLVEERADGKVVVAITFDQPVPIPGSTDSRGA